MASHQGTVDFIVEQSALAGTVSARKMFGEYGIYCDGKMVALVCDDRLFVKPTPDGKAFLGACEQAPPYPSAKPHLVVAGERWDEREWLSRLIRITAAQLPMPVKRGR
ncbi:TfoX/Sxy family protein [Burkholderia ubonensis]|uniref:Competence protein TfoX n=1 Tax=Burkholderia ubonensis TaxID=101571 RepID=A0A1B4LIJ1_9BURK|nr:TfoX/Sxy family protein [Burkholderia ubonensis]AOJ76944.1 competence protein TfoX [Burkholderia ubonensis]